MEIKTRRSTVKVKGVILEFNETFKYNQEGEEVYNRSLEMYNDLKLYEEYERITGDKILDDRHYKIFK